MPKVNRYVDIDQVEKEAKKDYIDRHSPFIHCGADAKAGKKFPVTIKMGNEYPHPDDNDHYIRNIQLFNRETLVAEASFPPGTQAGHGAKGHTEVTFHVVPSGSSMKLTAMAYCTKHGLWESDPSEVAVS